MKKIFNVLICAMFIIMIGTSLLVMMPEVQAGYIDVQQNYIEVQSNPLGDGRIQWIAYVVVFILIIFTIIKSILMIKHKKSSGKILSFIAIMIIIIVLISSGITALNYYAMIN